MRPYGVRRVAEELHLAHTTVRDSRRRFSRLAAMLAVGFAATSWRSVISPPGVIRVDRPPTTYADSDVKGSTDHTAIGTRCYQFTEHGRGYAVLLTKVHDRVLALGPVQPDPNLPAPTSQSGVPSHKLGASSTAPSTTTSTTKSSPQEDLT
jgi:hypothetical protein